MNNSNIVYQSEDGQTNINKTNVQILHISDSNKFYKFDTILPIDYYINSDYKRNREKATIRKSRIVRYESKNMIIKKRGQ